MIRRILLFCIILIAGYAFVLVNYPSDLIKSLGYNSFLTMYSATLGKSVNPEIIYDPGLRILPESGDIMAVIPTDNDNYAEIMKKILKGNVQAVVECSDLDSWHTTPEGQDYLLKIWPRAYRAVIFDGGHHLPTLGMAPDLIIIPVMNGYAVHSYMLDGIKADRVVQLAKEAKCPAVIATIPRWVLVKHKYSLQAAAQTALAAAVRTDKPVCCPAIQADLRISKVNGIVFVYATAEYFNNIDLLAKKITVLNLQDVCKVYIAFDYRTAGNIQKADCYAECLQLKLDVPVYRVNEPVKVLNSFGAITDELQQQGNNN